MNDPVPTPSLTPSPGRSESTPSPVPLPTGTGCTTTPSPTTRTGTPNQHHDKATKLLIQAAHVAKITGDPQGVSAVLLASPIIRGGAR